MKIVHHFPKNLEQVHQEEIGWYAADFSEEIGRGTALLDALEPDWPSMIRPAALDLAQGRKCILGQTVLRSEILLPIGEAVLSANGDEVNKPQFSHLTAAFSSPLQYLSPKLAQALHAVERVHGRYYDMPYGFNLNELHLRDEARRICETETWKCSVQGHEMSSAHSYRRSCEGVFNGNWGWEQLTTQWLVEIETRTHSRAVTRRLEDRHEWDVAMARELAETRR